MSVDSGRIYKASIAEGTRTALEQDGDIYHVNWVEGDLVTITDGVNTAYYKSLAGGSTSTELRRSGGTDPVGEAVAFFPSNISAYNLPANQSYVADNIKNSPMMGTIDGDHISFKNLCGIVRLDVSSLSDVKVRNIKLSADQGLSGTYTVKDNAAVVGGKGGVTLNCGSVAVGTGITHFFIALPANSYTGFSIEVNTADGSSFNFTAKTGTKLTVERSMVTGRASGTYQEPFHRRVKLIHLLYNEARDHRSRAFILSYSVGALRGYHLIDASQSVCSLIFSRCVRVGTKYIA